MLLKEWKKQQEHYYSPANPNNLVIMLGTGKPCDIRNLTKMYHTACKSGRMNKLTLGALKSFSKKQINGNGCTNADYFYSQLNEPILLPDLKKGTLRVMSMVTNQKINKKLMCEIQILLDKGKSIRSIASMVDIAESTIRSWIIKKLLRR